MLELADGSTRPFLDTPAQEMQPMISPGGRWLAYVSNESGQAEVYLQALPDGGQKRLISLGGGEEPLWLPSRSQLLYRHGDQVLAVPIEAGPPLVVGNPEVVLEGPYDSGGGFGAPNYDVTADGSRFLMSAPVEDSLHAQLNVVVHWVEELKARTPTSQ